MGKTNIFRYVDEMSWTGSFHRYLLDRIRAYAKSEYLVHCLQALFIMRKFIGLGFHEIENIKRNICICKYIRVVLKKANSLFFQPLSISIYANIFEDFLYEFYCRL